MRIVQISDSHLTARGGVTTDNFRIAVDAINALSPRADLVVNSGDLVIADPDDADDRTAAYEEHRAIEAPLRVVAGNHDVGDVGPDRWMQLSVTDERIAAFEETWGPHWWTVRVGGCTAVGINAQLFDSGLAAEHEQDRWLASLATAVADTDVLLFLHKPIWPAGRSRAASTLNLPTPVRERLLDRLSAGRLRVVASGHLHRSRSRRHGAVTEVWAPSTGFRVDPAADGRIAPGQQQLGFVVHDTTPAGDIESWVQPLTGGTDLTVGELAEGAEAIDAVRRRVPSAT